MKFFALHNSLGFSRVCVKNCVKNNLTLQGISSYLRKNDFNQMQKNFHSTHPGLWTNLNSDERCGVIISKSRDIYSNLAIEDWLFENLNLVEDQKILLLWRNEPCVVIGKFQNQWQECHTEFIARKRISLARRRSGGGCVYHDMGNINCSFITHRSQYNRKENLNFILEALSRTWPHLNLSINSRDDLLLDGKYKISGTAAKLVRDKAYHHCTLLVNVDRKSLKKALTSPIKDYIQSSASESVPSPTSCLSSVDGSIDPETVMNALANTFLGKSKSNQKELIQTVSCTESHFSGISSILSELRSWQWVYGICPKFTLSRHKLQFNVEKGLLIDLHILEGDNSSHSLIQEDQLCKLRDLLTGVPFCPITIQMLLEQSNQIPEHTKVLVKSALDFSG